MQHVYAPFFSSNSATVHAPHSLLFAAGVISTCKHQIYLPLSNTLINFVSISKIRAAKIKPLFGPKLQKFGPFYPGSYNAVHLNAGPFDAAAGKLAALRARVKWADKVYRLLL